MSQMLLGMFWGGRMIHRTRLEPVNAKIAQCADFPRVGERYRCDASGIVTPTNRLPL